MNAMDVQYLTWTVLPAVTKVCSKLKVKVGTAEISGDTDGAPMLATGSAPPGFLQLPAVSELAAHAWANVKVDEDGADEAKWTYTGGANEPDVEKNKVLGSAPSGSGGVGEERGATWADEMLGGGRSGTGATQLVGSTADNIEQEAVEED
eukprot:g6451.t1